MNKLLNVFIFVVGLALSFVVNLFTGDSEVQHFYNENRKITLIMGATLILFSVYFSYRDETQSRLTERENYLGRLKFVGSIALAGLYGFAGGLFLGLFLYWGMSLFVKEYATKFAQVVNFINSNGLHRIIPSLIGMTFGPAFRYVYGDSLSGVVIGGFIGFSASYYFPADFTLAFLPDWLGHSSIISSGLTAGAISLFTAIFEPEYNTIKSSSVRADLELKSQLEDVIQPKIERYETAVALLRSRGFTVYANNQRDRWLALLDGFVIRMLSMEGSSDSEEVRQKIKVFKDSPHYKLTKEVIDVMFLNNKSTLPKPPYRILNREGEEVQRFTSVEAFCNYTKCLY